MVGLDRDCRTQWDFLGITEHGGTCRDTAGLIRTYGTERDCGTYALTWGLRIKLYHKIEEGCMPTMCICIPISCADIEKVKAIWAFDSLISVYIYTVYIYCDTALQICYSYGGGADIYGV